MIVNKYNKGGGGSGSGATYTAGEYIEIQNDVISVTGITPDQYLTSADTQDLVSQAYVDTAISSATEDFATLEDLNGTTSTTQLAMTSSASTFYLATDKYLAPSYNGRVPLYETNLDNYVAVYLPESPVSGQTSFLVYNLTNGENFDAYGASASMTATTENVGVEIHLDGDGSIKFDSSKLGGTMDYYLLFNTSTFVLYILTELPVITEIDGGKPDYDDIPVAQDSSGVKYFVYNGVANKKNVLSRISGGGCEYSTGGTYAYQVVNYFKWNDDLVNRCGIAPLLGTETHVGMKTAKDSAIINKIGDAFSGFTEQVTLTLGSASATDYIHGSFYNGSTWAASVYFKETDNQRYEVFEFSQLADGGNAQYELIYYVSIGGNNSAVAIEELKNGVKVQLTDYAFFGNTKISSLVGGNYYLILDKELMTVEVTDSLTITRTRKIADIASGGTFDPTLYYTKAEVDAEIGDALTGYTSMSDFEDFQQAMMDKEEVVASALTELQSSIPDMSDYYTKDEVDAEVTGATQGFATQAYVTAATQNLASQAYVTSAVTAATQNMATQAYVTGITSPMQTAINGKVGSSNSTISNIITISQSDYDDLVSGGTVDATTFYVITGTTS